MKAIMWTGYGTPDVLQLREIDKPIPKDNEVLIRIFASTVTTGDCELRRSDHPLWIWLPLRIYVGVRKPRRVNILGMELAGVIESIGKDVTRFKEGDAIFGAAGFKFSANAEYICLPSTHTIVSKPASITYAEAAAIPTGGINALHFLRKANIQPGQKVLIYGSSGSIGTFAVQLAKYYGAEVTAVCSTKKIELVRALGADKVIDYTKEEFYNNGETYDVIFDTIGKSSFTHGLRSVKKNGKYILGNPKMSQMLRGLWISMISSKKVIFQFAGDNIEDLRFLSELMEAETIRSVIDRSFPLEQTIEAHRYVEEGHKMGNVVITVAE